MKVIVTQGAVRVSRITCQHLDQRAAVFYVHADFESLSLVGLDTDDTGLTLGLVSPGPDTRLRFDCGKGWWGIWRIMIHDGPPRLEIALWRQYHEPQQVWP